MRVPVTNDTLARLVVEELRGRTASSGEFTAYDITRSLRDHQPQLDIPHSTVRAFVHEYMNVLVSEGLYQASLCNFGNKTAILYEPASRDAWSDVPLLPLN